MATFKVNLPITPERSLESMRTAYDVNQIPGLIEIINDCLYLVSNSKNLETVINRLELGARKSYTLEQLEQIGFHSGKPTSKELFDVFLGEKPVLINNCLGKAYNDMLAKANELKTGRGKINRYKKFIEVMHKYDDDYTYENEELVERFEQELSSLITKMT
ncbi:hypothetical protein MKZ26_03515 [Sporosarcina sp. FSL K6-6792]|uniref:hypothetical protein n=1 Tax=Sporosarcina sp. FSL K6-6792 TaxID=2921559 RepID=UPI0030F9ED52